MAVIVHIIKTSKDFFKNFCYLVVDKDSHKGILVDPAWDLDKIESYLVNNAFTLSAILLTHHHIDHVNLAHVLAVKYNSQVLMNKIEISFYGFTCHHLRGIDESTHISCGHSQVIPITTPGHTRGSMCYLIEENLFTGDTLFIEGCGICFGKGADPTEMYYSLQKLKSRIHSDTFIYPSHSYGQKPGKRFNYLLNNNIYLQIDDPAQFISFRMRQNQSTILGFK
ncbi:MAG: MBL fold metallo-hydrolase [bacterium]